MRENIHLFGGDENQITIFGESAGGWSVSAHLLSSLSKGLFRRAIIESGAQLYNKDIPILTKENAIKNAKQIAREANCTDDKQLLQCLRTVDAHKLVVSKPFYTSFVEGTEFLPLSAQKAFREEKFNKGLSDL